MMEKFTSNEYERKSETFRKEFDWFNFDTPLEKGFDEIFQSRPLFMNNMNEKLEEKKYDVVGTPREHIAMLEQEFDDWARTNRYTEDTK
nr:hypothetical protein [Tanacetum cinerariifolium]